MPEADYQALVRALSTAGLEVRGSISSASTAATSGASSTGSTASSTNSSSGAAGSTVSTSSGATGSTGSATSDRGLDERFGSSTGGGARVKKGGCGCDSRGDLDPLSVVGLLAALGTRRSRRR